MGKNTTRNLGLSALVGLFAFYGYTANNLRIGSISTSGLVIKYSKRGLASISCPPINQEIDRITADSLSTEECRHHVSSTTLDNGDVEYTVTSYYRGHISTGTKVYPSQAIADEGHNTEFIKDIVRSSKAKFDATPAAQAENLQLASASVEETEEETPEVDTPAGDTPAEDVAAIDTDEEESEPAAAVVSANGAPTVTPPSSSSSDDSDDSDEESSSNTSERSGLDADLIEETIEKYADIKIAFYACQTDDKENKDIQSIVDDHERMVLKYLTEVEAGNNDDDESSPFAKLSDRKLRSFEKFVDAVEELDVSSSNNSVADPSKYSCLLERNKEIKDRDAKFAHFRQYIQPWLRVEMQNPERLAGISQAINENGNPISDLVKSNPMIASAIIADHAGAITKQRLDANTAEMANVSTSEPARSQELQTLAIKRDDILSKHASFLSDLKLRNPEASSAITESSQNWTGSGEFQMMTSTPATSVAGQSTTNQSEFGSSETNPREQLEAMFARIKAAAEGTGTARQGAVLRRGNFDANSQRSSRRSLVPQLGDSVKSID